VPQFLSARVTDGFSSPEQSSESWCVVAVCVCFVFVSGSSIRLPVRSRKVNVGSSHTYVCADIRKPREFGATISTMHIM
jgi:hypothetical protein